MKLATEEISEADLLRLAIDDRLIDLHVALPCKVEAYHVDTQTVDVVPQCDRHLPDGAGNYVTEQLPKLGDIPVMFPRSQQFSVTFPIEAGDYGLLVFCERNIGAWRATGNQGDPGDVGTHTLDGAVFIPGLYPDSAASQVADGTNMVVGSESDGDSRIEIKPNGGLNLGAGATDQVVTKADFDALKTTISSAAITGTNDGGLSFKNAIVAGWPASVGSTKIKAVR